MLEVTAHNHLKNFFREASSLWPHNLTLSRFVARSLRRRDNAVIQLELGSQDFWWPGVLIPLSLDPSSSVLVLSAKQQHRLLTIELPRLRKKGFHLACWEGPQPPSGGQAWILNYLSLVEAYKAGNLQGKQLLIPEAELLNQRLRDAMCLRVNRENWEELRRAHPSADTALLNLYERISRRLFSHASRIDAQVRMDLTEIIALRDLIGLFSCSPSPWPDVVALDSENWASWATLDHKTLNWTWSLQLIEPLKHLKELFLANSVIFLTGRIKNNLFFSQLESIQFPVQVNVTLGGPILQEPISLFAPKRQPLPNTEVYSQHLLEQSRRLVLGLSGLTIVLLDDDQLRYQLTSGLASDFGTRVLHEELLPESNGVVSCRWSWWLDHQHQLPVPEQLIIGLLPLASLEDPLISAMVESLKKQGRDWFRELLLPEALRLLSGAVAPIRGNHGRLAILDGRLRSRSWGEQVFRTLEPWTPLQRLLPS